MTTTIMMAMTTVYYDTMDILISGSDAAADVEICLQL